MIREASNINQLWSLLIIEELLRLGVEQFFISPGSRSTPLVTAIALHDAAKTCVHFDERGSAFAALGYSKATGSPAVWVTTSGTAVANGLPSAIEAHMDGIPLILLTADRPPELRDTGANQSINQASIFSPYVKWSLDGPTPTTEIPPSFVLTSIDQAVYRSLTSGNGPVHINWMFREPLAPKSTGDNFGEYLGSIENWIGSTAPYTEYKITHKNLSIKNATFEQGLIHPSDHKGLVLAGRLKTKDESVWVKKLAASLGWPLYADISSQIRLGLDETKNELAPLSPLLFSPSIDAHLPKPQTVIQFGKIPASKHVLAWINSVKPSEYLIVDHAPARIDPFHGVSTRIEADISEFCQTILSFNSTKNPLNQSWNEDWVKINEQVIEKLDNYFDKNNVLSEPYIARVISEQIKPDSTLVIGNSMPIRDIDSFASYYGSQVSTLTNRGASGIDGTIATAIGASIATNKPVTVILGDLALLHDLNSLAMARHLDASFIVIVVNNNGGGIFSFLPIAEFTDVFEPFFGTPNDVTFNGAAKMFDAAYYKPSTIEEFRSTYSQAMEEKGFFLIEVETDRKENLLIHKNIERHVSAGLRENDGNK